MKSNGNKNKENNTKNINDYNIEQLPKMISLKQRNTSNMPYKIEQEEQSSCSSSSKVPSRFQPSRSPNNRSSLFGLPATPYLGPSLSPVSSPQWRMAAGSSSPGATAGRAVPKSALIMSRILTSRVGGISNMELMQSVSGTKDIIEKTSLDCHGVEEQSNYDKVIDFPYHRSPTSSPLGSLIMKTEVCTELNNELEIKTTECIFNFEDIFEDEEMERKGKENEFEECKETNLLNKKPMMIENNKVFPSENPFSEVMNEKEIEEENIQSGSGLAKYETKFERKANNKQRENKSRRRSGKKDRMVERRKLIEEKSKADKEDNDVKEEFLNNENKVTNNNLPILKGDGSCSQKEQKKYDESEKEIVGNFVLTAQDLIAQVERIMFTSLSEKCSLQIISLSNNKEEVKTKKESDKLKQSFSEKGIQHQKLLNKEKELEENSLEVKDSIIGGPTDEKKEKGRKGKSSKRKGKRYNCVSRKPLPLLQSFDQQNTPEEKDMEENMLTSPCSTTSSPSFPCSSSSALIRGDEQNSSRPNSSIGRMIGRWRHTTGGIQLRNITLASVWERLATGIRSEGRDAFRASSAVQLTNTTRYNMDEVLPLIHYRPLYQNLIRSIHFSPASHSFISLLQCLPINIENLAKPLMKIFIHSNQMRQFFRLICFEYLSNSSDVNTLFRSQSLASKVMYEMMKCVGHKYLVCTLMPLIDLIFTERKSCEIDPSKLRVGESLDQNFHNITVYAELAFSRVVDSSQRCPPALRELFAELRDVVEQFFPGREDVGRLALSSFLILRFFAAAILNPKLFGLKMATPDVNISRTLVLVSKILQRIANCVVSANPPSTKEQWLSPLLQQFSDELHNKAMIDFLDEISMSFTETEESGDNTAGRAMVDNSNVDSFTSPTNTDTLGVDIVKELHIVYSQIADHLDALCSMGWCCRYACSCSTTIVQ